MPHSKNGSIHEVGKYPVFNGGSTVGMVCGKEAAGTYNVVVTYSEEAGETKTSTQSVYLIK
ncbi:MAG: hypothetical protein ACKO4Y_01950 [Flavobacteriales bacterium]